MSKQFREQYDEIYADVLHYEVSKYRNGRSSTNVNNINNNNFENQQQQQPQHFEINTTHNNDENFTHRQNNRNKNGNKNESNLLLSQELISSSKMLSMFLCDFVEKASPHRWEIKEKAGLEMLIGPFPSLWNEKSSIFYDGMSMCNQYFVQIEH